MLSLKRIIKIYRGLLNIEQRKLFYTMHIFTLFQYSITLSLEHSNENRASCHFSTGYFKS